MDTIKYLKTPVLEVLGFTINVDDTIGKPYRVMMRDGGGEFYEYHNATSFMKMLHDEAFSKGLKMKMVAE